MAGYRYAAEIIEAMLRFGFETLDLREVRGLTVAANVYINWMVRHYGFAGNPLPRSAPGALPRMQWLLSRAAWRHRWINDSEERNPSP